MKFLIDAHLPRRLKFRLEEHGHDSIHTLDLPLGNKTTDMEIEKISITEKRVVITKDEDFVSSFTIRGKPYKLLLASTGNIKNTDLEELFSKNFSRI